MFHVHHALLALALLSLICSNMTDMRMSILFCFVWVHILECNWYPMKYSNETTEPMGVQCSNKTMQPMWAYSYRQKLALCHQDFVYVVTSVTIWQAPVAKKLITCTRLTSGTTEHNSHNAIKVSKLCRNITHLWLSHSFNTQPVPCWSLVNAYNHLQGGYLETPVEKIVHISSSHCQSQLSDLLHVLVNTTLFCWKLMLSTANKSFF